MEAVNPVIQSAIVDKYGKPFAQKTQKIVEQLDVTVEKQEVVIEKQNKIGDKVKNVINTLDRAGGNFNDAFSRSSDGLKELSMGFIDIKDIIETVSKKFKAFGDLIAPVSETLNFAFGDAGQKAKDFFLGDNQKKLIRDTSSPLRRVRKGEQVEFEGKTYKGGQMLPSGVDEDGQIIQMSLAKRLNNSFKGLFKSIGNITKAFGRLVFALIPLTLKFLLFGGLFAVVAFGIGKLISALGGWDLLKAAVDGLQSLFTKFKVAMNSVIMFLDDWTPGKLISDESRAEKEQFNNQEKNKSFLEKRINQDAAQVGEIMNDKTLSDEDKLNKINEKKLVTSDSTITDTGTIVSSDGEQLDYRPGTEDNQAFLMNKDIQADLDMLAIKSAQMRQKLDTQLERAKKRGDKEEVAQLEKSIEASDNFIAEYDKTYGEGAFTKTMADYGEFVSSRNAFQDRSAGRFLSMRDGTDIREFNDAGSNYSRFVLNAPTTGENIKKQLDENKTNILDANAKGTFASVMAPSLTQQITSVYENKNQPPASETISK